jgi:4-amino-4-deoxy-L-arabinose transferase-like glycosyltransferase
MINIPKPALFLSLTVVFILLFMLFFPLSSDLSIYLQAGKTIVKGGSIYFDYIDIKPPLFYLFYSLIYILTGNEPVLVRLFDVLWQSATVLLMYKILSRSFPERNYAAVSVLVYAVSYVILNFSSTMHPENFAQLPILLLCYNILYSKDRKAVWLLNGVLIGFLFGIKYTLLIVLLVPIIWDFYLKKPYKSLLLKYLFYFIGFVAITIIGLIPILNRDSWQGFWLVQKFLSGYSTNIIFNSGFIKFVIHNTSIFLLEYFSILLFTGLTICFFIILNKRSFIDNAKVIKISIIVFMLLLATVIIENKLSIYHFSRIYAAASILAGIGLSELIASLTYSFKKSSFLSKSLIQIACLFLFVFSPVPRFINIMYQSFNYFFAHSEYIEHYTRPQETFSTLLGNYIEIIDYLHSNSKPGEMLLTFAVSGNIVNFFTDELRHSKFSQSLFIISNYSIPEWNELFKDELQKADWLVTQSNDLYPSLTGNGMTSKKWLEQTYPYDSIFHANYELVKQIDNLYIYHRKIDNHGNVID